MIDLLRDHPGGLLACLITALGVLGAVVIGLDDWRDWRAVRTGNGAAAFVAREALQRGGVRILATLLLCLITVLALRSAVAAVNALPPAARRTALRRMHQLSGTQIAIVVLYGLLVLVIDGDAIRGLWMRRRFRRKYATPVREQTP